MHKILFCSSLFVLCLTFVKQPALAQFGMGCAGPAYCAIHQRTRDSIKDHSDEAFEDYEDNFIGEELAREYFIPALQYLTEQITVGDAENTEQHSSLTDAENTAGRINAQRTAVARESAVLEITDNMCERSTLTSGIAATAQNVAEAERRGVQEGISEDMGAIGVPGSEGPGELRNLQVERYVNIYADPNDFEGAIAAAYEVTASDPSRYNRDVNPFFLNTYTLDYDATNPAATDAGQDIRALRLNLFGHDLPRIPSAVSTDPEATDEIADYNRVAQFQGLARTSFDAIVTLRQRGNSEVAPYMRAMLAERGITQPNIVASIIGEEDAPSFMAQAKILTQYQSRAPEQAGDNMAHSADLYRRQVTNDALSLLVKYRIYESLKRQTAHFIAIHELKTDPLRDRIETF